MENIIGRVFLACAAAFVLAAAVVAAVRIATPISHGWWLVAYLGLVGGVSQALLGPGLNGIVDRSGGRRSGGAASIAHLVLWNVGTVLVAVGVLADSSPGVLAGSVLMLVALGWFAVSLRRAGSTAARPVRAWMLAYALLLVFLGSSVVVGAALANAIPGQSAAPSFTNPVFGSDFPDPFVPRDGGTA